MNHRQLERIAAPQEIDARRQVTPEAGEHRTEIGESGAQERKRILVRTEPPLGDGRPDVVLGATAGRDALFLYVWGNARVHVPIPGGRREAPWAFAANGAVGTRFWEPRIRGADLVPLLEVGYRAEAPMRTHGHGERDSGHQHLTLGPSVLYFYDRYELKAGLQWMAWRRVRGRQLLAEVELVFGLGVLI